MTVTVMKARRDSLTGETKIVTIRDRGDLPEAEHQSPASGTQNLSVLAAGNGDRTAESRCYGAGGETAKLVASINRQIDGSSLMQKRHDDSKACLTAFLQDNTVIAVIEETAS